MALSAGRLRHRITIQSPLHTQNTTTGEQVKTWTDFAEDVPAAVEPLSAREFIAAQATQSEIVARIVIRYRPGLTADMRILHGSEVYNVAGWLPDPDSGREWITAPVYRGVNNG